MVGTIIHETLKSYNIVPKGKCGCENLMEKMNRFGPSMCEKYINLLVSEMSQSAAKWIGLPVGFAFKAGPAKALIQFGINEARRLGDDR